MPKEIDFDMNSSRLEWKVGVFVATGLVILIAMVVQFSRGWTLFTPTYVLRLKTVNVGGIKPQASVLMAGVTVGSVLGTDLDSAGNSATIRVKILSKYPIHRDAQFFIEQAGFLGDQYISVMTRGTNSPVLRDQEEVPCQEPFNLQDAARSAVSLMQRIEKAATTLDAAVARVDKILLSEQTLTNLTAAIANFHQLSEQATAASRSLRLLLQTNESSITLTFSNFARFSDRLYTVSGEIENTLTNNQAEIATTIRQLESASTHVNRLAADLQAGQGLAGSILKDEHLQQQFHELVGNLTTLSSNLNKYGLLYKPKPKPKPVSRASELHPLMFRYLDR
jgi:phospholipid/cholesterol/gamma-HCH transport system substrate-binding protein